MKEQFQFGGITFISFIILDIVCLVVANLLASWIYLSQIDTGYTYIDYRPVIVIMVAIDIAVTFLFNTLDKVLRRRKRIEVVACFEHVMICFGFLAFFLFLIKHGAEYSRVTVFLAYAIDYVLIVGSHYLWKKTLYFCRKKDEKLTAVLMTTDKFVDEGIKELSKSNIEVSDIFLLKNKKKEKISGIPVSEDIDRILNIICWKWIDKVYIYGLDDEVVPDKLRSECKSMGVKVEMVDFKYKVIDIETVQADESNYGQLTFLEGKRDIPFPIRRAYWITETDAELHRGFHAHKLNCQLLFCPYGKIDIILDDGENIDTIRLSDPSKGLLLMPGLWREMVWKKSGSVLCVLASEYYDPEEYIRDYNDFIAFHKNYED